MTSRTMLRTCGAECPASLAAATSSLSSEVRDERAPRAMCEAPALAKLRAVWRPMPYVGFVNC